MNTFILNHIPCDLDLPAVMKRLHMSEKHPNAPDFKRLVAEARTIANPKAYYRIERIDSKRENAVVINGITLASRVLRVNLEGLNRVFIFVATCGAEMEKWSRTHREMIERFWADALCTEALNAAVGALYIDLKDRFKSGKPSTMTPGSITDWPIREQKHVFTLLGDPEKTIGVTLNENGMMIPMKSVSGILFAAAEGFESCELCPIKKCPDRRKAYDETLYNRKFARINN